MGKKDKTFPVEILNPVEVQKFFATFGRSRIDRRNLALCVVYLRAQLRCKEALALRRCDIDYQASTIVVLNGKGGKRRTVGIDQESIRYLQEWDAIRPPSSKYFFCTLRGGAIHDSYVRRLVKRQADHAGIEKRVHPHAFRHLGACQLADEGVDLRIIQKVLGHSNLAVTARYLDHLQAGEAVNVMKNRSWSFTSTLPKPAAAPSTMCIPS